MKNVRSIFYCVLAVLFTAIIMSSCKDGVDGKDGVPGSIVTIGTNCNWWINGVDTGEPACAQDGVPGSVISIGANGNWWIDGVDTGKQATGPQGAPGSVVTIGANGNWYIDGEDTGVSAIGQGGGETPVLELSSTDPVTFSATGTVTSGTNTFTVDTNYPIWDAVSSDESWLTVNISGMQFTLTATVNDFVEPVADATVTVTAGILKITLKVSQSGNPAGVPRAAATKQTWTLSNGTINQVWSDYIEYDGDGKIAAGTIEDFSSTGTEANYRSHPDYPGYLYNWYYVVAHQTELCPSPWRVPSGEDIANMDLAMGGTGENQQFVDGQVTKYLDEMGIIRHGRVNANNTFSYSGTIGYIITYEEAIPTATDYQNKPSHFALDTNGSNQCVFPQDELISSSTKNVGMTVRCVKDGE